MVQQVCNSSRFYSPSVLVTANLTNITLLNAVDLAGEVQNFLGYGKKIENNESDEIRNIHQPTESEVALSMRLKYDKEAGSDEIVPCCTYFCWGTYIACCTDDVNTLKLLGVYVEKPRDKMDFEHSRLYVTRVKATGVQSAEFTGTQTSVSRQFLFSLHYGFSHLSSFKHNQLDFCIYLFSNK